MSAAVLGAGVGSAIGGWFSDKLGRKKALLLGDLLFTVGALLMAAARSPNALIAGQDASLLVPDCTCSHAWLLLSMLGRLATVV